MVGDTSTSYCVLPVRLRRNASTLRNVYVKSHAGHDSLPKDRTLFVTGLPFGLHEVGLLELFSKFGTVERAAIHGSKTSAVVLFETAASKLKTLSAAVHSITQELDMAEPDQPYGLKGGWLELKQLL